MRKIIVILSLFAFAFTANADEYIKKYPSAYTYKSIYDDLYLLLDGSNSPMTGEFDSVPDTDATFTFGRWTQGFLTGFPDIVWLSHYDKFDWNTYALSQDSTGDTYLNGRYIYLSIGGSSYIRIYLTGARERMVHFISGTMLGIGGTLGSERVEIRQFGTNPTILNFMTDYTDLRLTVDGTVTANTVSATTIKTNTYTFPTIDGTANYVMKTDGAGTISWQAEAAGATNWGLNNLSGYSTTKVLEVGGIYGTDISGNTISGNTINAAGAYTLTRGVGTSGQYLQTDGLGNTKWETVAGTSVINWGLNNLSGYSTTKILEVGGLGGTDISGNTVSGNSVYGSRIVGDRIYSDNWVSGNTISGNTINVAGAYTLTQGAGTSGQFLQTNGSGSTLWATPTNNRYNLDNLEGYSTTKILQVGGIGGNLISGNTVSGNSAFLSIVESDIIRSSIVTGTTISANTINVSGDYTFPQTDGSNGQVMKTDGSGVLTWQSSTASSSGSLIFTFDGGGSQIATNSTIWARIPYNATINTWEISSLTTGSTVINIHRTTYTGAPAIGGLSIAGTEKPTLTNQQRNRDTALGTWTTSVNAGDYIQAIVESSDIVTFSTVVINYTK